jgi:hypothetical protein
MPAETAVDMVVLAVDIGSDGAADRDVSRSRRDRHEPALWGVLADELANCHSSVDAHDASLAIDPSYIRALGCNQHRAPASLGGISVAAAEAAGDQIGRGKFAQGKVFGIRWHKYSRRRTRVASPPLHALAL